MKIHTITLNHFETGLSAEDTFVNANDAVDAFGACCAREADWLRDQGLQITDWISRGDDKKLLRVYVTNDGAVTVLLTFNVDLQGVE